MKKFCYSLAILALVSISTISYTQNVGVGVENPKQKLDVDGALKIGYTETAIPGSIRWTGEHFQGFNGFAWITLDMNGDVTFDELAWIKNENYVFLLESDDKVGIGVETPKAKLEVNGTQALRTGSLVIEDGGPFHNVVLPEKSVVSISGPNKPVKITGFAGGFDGRLLYLHNGTGTVLKIDHMDEGSDPINQIRCKGNAERILKPNETCLLIYHGELQSWLML